LKNEEAVQEVEEPEAVVEEIVDEEASKVNAQNFKNALLAAAEESLSGPSNISYYDVTVSLYKYKYKMKCIYIKNV